MIKYSSLSSSLSVGQWSPLAMDVSLIFLYTKKWSTLWDSNPLTRRSAPVLRPLSLTTQQNVAFLLHIKNDVMGVEPTHLIQVSTPLYKRNCFTTQQDVSFLLQQQHYGIQTTTQKNKTRNCMGLQRLKWILLHCNKGLSNPYYSRICMFLLSKNQSSYIWRWETGWKSAQRQGYMCHWSKYPTICSQFSRK